MWEGTGVTGSRNRGARSQRRKNTWRLWKVGRGEGEVRTRPFELRVGPRPLTRWLVCAAAERAARVERGSCSPGGRVLMHKGKGSLARGVFYLEQE